MTVKKTLFWVRIFSIETSLTNWKFAVADQEISVVEYGKHLFMNAPCISLFNIEFIYVFIQTTYPHFCNTFEIILPALSKAIYLHFRKIFYSHF